MSFKSDQFAISLAMRKGVSGLEVKKAQQGKLPIAGEIGGKKEGASHRGQSTFPSQAEFCTTSQQIHLLLHACVDLHLPIPQASQVVSLTFGRTCVY